MRHYPAVLLSLNLLFFLHCARPCPKDIGLGNLDLSSETTAFFPVEQQVQTMKFESESGRTRIFNNQNPDFAKRFRYDVETLCERGDFLDKTVQTYYYDAQAFHFYYRSTDDSLTISIDTYTTNQLGYGRKEDTAFYETFAVGMFGTGPKASNGAISLISDFRGNAALVPQNVVDGATIYDFKTDTLVGGRNLQSVYVTPEGNQRDIFIFYTKARGMEAFSANNELWWRVF